LRAAAAFTESVALVQAGGRLLPAQARKRAAPGPENKGAEAARAAVMTALALRAIGGKGRAHRAPAGRRAR